MMREEDFLRFECRVWFLTVTAITIIVALTVIYTGHVVGTTFSNVP